jgi:hypothetical protein
VLRVTYGLSGETLNENFGVLVYLSTPFIRFRRTDEDVVDSVLVALPRCRGVERPAGPWTVSG